MTDGSEQKDNSGRKPQLTLTRNVSGGTVRQSFSHGRTKQVAVEVREKRSVNRPGGAASSAAPSAPGPGVPPPLRARAAGAAAAPKPEPKPQPGGISDDEARRREDAVRRAQAEKAARDARNAAEEAQRRALEDAQRKHAEQEAAQQAELEALRRGEDEPEPQQPLQAEPARTRAPQAPTPAKEEGPALLDELGGRIKSARRPLAPAPVKPTKKGEPKRREGRLTLDMVEREVAGDDDRVRSLAAYRRAQQKEKERRARLSGGGEREQIKREVTIPETISIQDLA
ncbi:MAG: translation initiation factor IF-2 associated domain-containing protein, partial [Proteobacteria bacterium]|nr:translation initiation factor IF-2 associated domain-containing protein [Pseudomonadota bacterium]